MNTLTLTIVIAGSCVVLMEFLLWELFCKRVKGFIFPREIDMSPLRFFTLMRLRVCVLLHTVFMLLAVVGSLWFTW